MESIPRHKHFASIYPYICPYCNKIVESNKCEEIVNDKCNNSRTKRTIRPKDN